MDAITSTQAIRESLPVTPNIGEVPRVDRSQPQPSQGRSVGAPPPAAGVDSDTVSQTLNPQVTQRATSRNEIDTAISAIGAAEAGLAAVEQTLQLVEESIRAQTTAVEQDRAQQRQDYAALTNRIDTTVQQSGSDGPNLLAGESRTVYPGGGTVTIPGANVTSAALGLETSTPSVLVVDTARTQIGEAASALSSAASTLSARSGDLTTSVTGVLDEAVGEDVQANLTADEARSLSTRVQNDLTALTASVAAQSQAAIAQLV